MYIIPCKVSLDYYYHFIRFAESELRERLEKDNYDIKNRVEEEHFSETLNSVMTDLTNARTEEEHNIILNRLETIRDCDETKKLAAEVMNHKKTLEKVREGVKILKEEEAIRNGGPWVSIPSGPFPAVQQCTVFRPLFSFSQFVIEYCFYD